MKLSFDACRRIMWPQLDRLRRLINRGFEEDVRNLDQKKALKYLVRKYGTNRNYTEYFLNHMLSHHKSSPQFGLYLESELGSLNRSRMFVKSLCREFGNDKLFLGKECLDIGSSAGNALIAFIENGASQATGIEVCVGRFQTSMVNIEGCSKDVKSRIQIFREDIQDEGVTRIGQFDVIFCNDVLEHVEKPVLAIKSICRLLKDTPDAFAYINLRNFQNPENIIHEPHYDVPGMVLLPRELAQRYYNFCKKDESLAYEVYQWLSFYDYQTMFTSFGKRAKFYGLMNPNLSGITHIENESKRIPLAFEEFSRKNGLDAGLKGEVECFIAEYLSNLRKTAEACRRSNDKKLLEAFYMNYVIFDITMVVTNEK